MLALHPLTIHPCHSCSMGRRRRRTPTATRTGSTTLGHEAGDHAKGMGYMVGATPGDGEGRRERGKSSVASAKGYEEGEGASGEEPEGPVLDPKVFKKPAGRARPCSPDQIGGEEPGWKRDSAVDKLSDLSLVADPASTTLEKRHSPSSEIDRLTSEWSEVKTATARILGNKFKLA